jgi:hypothetical protein
MSSFVMSKLNTIKVVSDWLVNNEESVKGVTPDIDEIVSILEFLLTFTDSSQYKNYLFFNEEKKNTTTAQTVIARLVYQDIQNKVTKNGTELDNPKLWVSFIFSKTMMLQGITISWLEILQDHKAFTTNLCKAFEEAGVAWSSTECFPTGVELNIKFFNAIPEEVIASKVEEVLDSLGMDYSWHERFHATWFDLVNR